jgi:hypothetical protein
VRALEIEGADLAERFTVRSASSGPAENAAAIQPGFVVAIDPENPGELVVSTRAYDARVAGVISGAGGMDVGILLGRDIAVGRDRQPVAMTGRVYCWADTSGGPITPGDLLTTSSRAGHAMKVADHGRAQGAILGKAMTPLERNSGLVLVLVALQ